MEAGQEKELTDIALCYQALGVEITATPTTIERVYRSLSEEYKEKLASTDPAAREGARVNLEQLGDIYGQIRASVTYSAMEKGLQKGNTGIPDAKRFDPKCSVRVHCTRCNGLIPKGLRTCPICKSPLYRPLEHAIRSLLAPKKLILYFALLIAVFLAAFGVQHQGKLSTESLGQLLQVPKK